MPIIEDLIVSDYGAFVGLKGRRLRVTVPNLPPQEAPIMHLITVQIATRSASISAAALGACCEAGVPVLFVDPVDGNYASVLSPHLTTVTVSRHAQIAAINTDLGVSIARQIASGKIRSQITNLRYLARRLDEEAAEVFRLAQLDLTDYVAALEAVDGSSIGAVRDKFMGIEGRSARVYWDALDMLIPDNYDWPGRKGRHATDAVNSLLNYGYGILYSEVHNALVVAGLEPYVGLLHSDRPGKPSLTLDLVEEFRAPIVDRTVIGLVGRQFKVVQDDNGRMSRDTRRLYADHILSRLSAQGIYQRKRYQLRSIIQKQARLLASAFRNESNYIAYTGG
jgi:CRISP-associated protein Cas1